LSLNPATVNAGSGGPVAMMVTVAPTSGSGTPTGSVDFYLDGVGIRQPPAVLSNGTATFSYNPSTLAAGTHSITAGYLGDSTFGPSLSAAQTLSVQDFQAAANPTTVNISAPGQSGQTTLTITPEGGFNQSVSFTCSGLPSESTCSFNPGTVTPNGAAVVTSVTIQTTGPHAQLDRRHSRRNSAVFYALLIPGFMGLILLAGDRKRRSCRVSSLGLFGILLFSTLWTSCGGGSNSTPSNPGTPAGSTTVTVTVAGSGTSPITHQMQITLTVQ
jgi:hypothetical protein